MKREKQLDPLMNYKQVAEFLGLSEGTVKNYVCSGFIPHIRLSSRLVRFRRKDIDAWLDERTKKGRRRLKIPIEDVVI